MTKRQQIKYGILLGLILIMIYLGLSLFIFECPTENQYVALRLLIALGAAAFASIIPGFIELKYRKLITASGAIAVFIILLIINPEPISSYTSCNESINIRGNIFLNHRPFEMAEVYLIELDSRKIYSNDNGNFTYEYKGTLDFDELTVRIKSDILKIDTSIVSTNYRKFMKFKIHTQHLDMSTLSQRPIDDGVMALEDLCIECTAKDVQGEIVNFKKKCDNDSLYLKNYINGFTKASIEQNRTVNCIWK